MQIIVCIGEAVALMTSNIAIIFTNLTLKEAFETDAQLNEGVSGNSMERFAKCSKFYSIDFFIFSQNVENR